MFREVTIGLINVFMGLDIFYMLPGERSDVEKLGKAILITASALLVLGSLFVQKQHRANILLTWLIASVLYIGSRMYAIDKCRYDSCLTLGIYGILLVCMEGVIYNVYTKELEKSKDKDLSVYETKPVVEKLPAPTALLESYPPSYEANVPQVHVY